MVNHHGEIRRKLAVLGDIVSVTSFALGNVNKTYKVTTRDRVFSVRVFYKLDYAEVSRIVRLLQSAASLSVPKPVPVNGEYVFLIDGKPAMVYEFILGTVRSRITDVQRHAVGAFLGKFHTQGDPSWDNREHFYELSEKKIEDIKTIALEKKLPRLDILEELIALVSRYYISEQIPKGPIHVDLKPENVLFHRGVLSGVLDFDNAYRGPLLLDVAKSAVWFGLLPRGGFSIERARAIVVGYRSVRDVTNAELAELYKAFYYAFISHIIMDYYMYATGKTSRAYFEYIIGDFYASYCTFAKIDTATFEKTMRAN